MAATPTTFPTHIRDLIPDPNNARRHTPANVGMVGNAMQEVGPARSIVIDEDNIILAGNATVDAAAAAGIEYVQVWDRATGELGPPPPPGETPLMAVRVSGLTPDQKTRLALYDNRAAELAEWDEAVIAAIAPEVLEGIFSADFLSGILDDVYNDNPYSQKVETPIYTPTMDAPPPLADLYNTAHRDRLAEEIRKTPDIPEEVRAFLLAAAERHTVFDYQNIAEFYAHASPAVQRLMEASALVIVDLEKAIENGYVRAKDRFMEMVEGARDE